MMYNKEINNINKKINKIQKEREQLLNNIFNDYSETIKKKRIITLNKKELNENSELITIFKLIKKNETLCKYYNLCNFNGNKNIINLCDLNEILNLLEEELHITKMFIKLLEQNNKKYKSVKEKNIIENYQYFFYQNIDLIDNIFHNIGNNTIKKEGKKMLKIK